MDAIHPPVARRNRAAPLFYLILVALILMIPAFEATAASPSDNLDRGPKVGESVPHPLTATDQSGKARSLPSLVGKRGLILLFTRSLDW